jgi:ribonucleoside-diphosphate reductase alpha chain
MNKDIEKLLKERYYSKGENSWSDVANRVSTIYPPIKEHIEKMEFIPSSPTLMNWNTNRTGTLSSCFPVGIKDSIEDIFGTLSDCAKITKYSGGIGIDFSTLRSSQESVTGIGNRNSSGPLPFIQIFNSMLDGVSQGGSRRGAGMSQMSIQHPDILQFIEAKKNYNDKRFNRFNFSVRISDE